jgi:quercetin dioxygenase-like cupin family protein
LVEILESLQNRLPETGALQRIVIFGPETGARYLSAVLVRVPAGHEFPLHTHPRSEDCFFALAGGGTATEPGRAISIAAPAGVWIPAGHPHGLTAGPGGMLEVGFQAPPDPTAVPFDTGGDVQAAQGLLTQSLPPDPESGGAPATWIGLFPSRPAGRYLDLTCATLRASERIVADAHRDELVVIVARGVVEVAGGVRCRLGALGALRLDPGTAVELRALESPALLLGVRARGVAEQPGPLS